MERTERKFVLLDLDGTLIPMSRDCFEPALFENLDGMFRGVFPDWEEVADAVRRATFACLSGGGGSGTNMERLNRQLEALLGERTGEVLAAMDRHYQTGYQRLAEHLQGPSPAGAVMEMIGRYKGIPVLATNPNAPMSCIRARMSWVGLKPEQFFLVTTAERFHYLKPDPRYFGELLEQLEASAEECLMIGNDTDEDIEAARAVGIDTYLVTDYLMDRRNSVDRYRHGTAEEMLDYLEQFLSGGTQHGEEGIEH